MRIEKGHVAGNEINGQTTARDLGLGRMMSTKKDYIGRVMAQRPALLDAGPADASSASSRSTATRACAPARISCREGAQPTAAQRPGLHDLGRLLADARPLDRARPAGARARAHRRARARLSIPCATATWRSRSCDPVLLRSRRGAPAWLTDRKPLRFRAGRRRHRPAAMAAARASRRDRRRGAGSAGLATVMARKGRRSALDAAARVRLRRRAARSRRAASEARRHRLHLVRARISGWPTGIAAPAEGMEALLARPFAGLAADRRPEPRAHAAAHHRARALRDALAKGAAIDLHPRAFKSRACGRHRRRPHRRAPLADRRPRRPTNSPSPRSFALSFWHWLEASAAEFGLEYAGAEPAGPPGRSELPGARLAR